MTVTSRSKDLEALTLTFRSEFDAPIERVWLLWADPRQLERWWGPPTWPATVMEYDFREGGRAHYLMTGPDGEQARGLWNILRVVEPEFFEFEDAFATPEGEMDPSLGTTRAEVRLESLGERTSMTIVSHFESVEQLEQLTEMGMEEGMRLALEQIDDILAS